MLKKLHHNAYRCRDSEETRAFYEGFLGLPLAEAFEIHETKSGRATETLHSFYALDDGSFLAFFEAPDMPFDFKKQHDFDLHIALEVEAPALAEMLARGKAVGIESRGIVDQHPVRVPCVTTQRVEPVHDRVLTPFASNTAADSRIEEFG